MSEDLAVSGLNRVQHPRGALAQRSLELLGLDVIARFIRQFPRPPGVKPVPVCVCWVSSGVSAHILIGGWSRPSLPAELYQLSSLISLWISNCHELRRLTDDIRDLENLRILAVNWCPQLTSLSPAIGGRKGLSLWFEEVALTSPPLEIVNQGIDAVRNYFESVDESKGLDYLYEAKMVLVGRGFSGKTSLVRKLTNPGYHLEENIRSTEGIAIDTWDMEMPLQKSNRFRFNIWDFGGQEKYDATHQFFITERTIYLFVTEARQESNFLDFDYWLNVVQMLGNNSPVIVVQNKIDLRKKSLPSKKYRAEFPNIIDFVDVSCADRYEKTVEKLKHTIQQAVT